MGTLDQLGRQDARQVEVISEGGVTTMIALPNLCALTSEIVIPMRTRDPLHFTGEVFLKHWALPNFFFHISMAYALLRQAGVELGKSDFLATP